MTSRSFEHVRFVDETSGVSRWHVVDGEASLRAPDHVAFVTLCGRRVEVGEEDDHSQVGTAPSGLTGRSICYDCGRDQRELEAGEGSA